MEAGSKDHISSKHSRNRAASMPETQAGAGVSSVLQDTNSHESLLLTVGEQ